MRFSSTQSTDNTYKRWVFHWVGKREKEIERQSLCIFPMHENVLRFSLFIWKLYTKQQWRHTQKIPAHNESEIEEKEEEENATKKIEKEK